MPVSTVKLQRSVAAAFKDPEAASVACSLLREGGVSAEEGAPHERFGDRGVRAFGLLPDQFERAMVILRNAGAVEISDGESLNPNEISAPGARTASWESPQQMRGRGLSSSSSSSRIPPIGVSRTTSPFPTRT